MAGRWHGMDASQGIDGTYYIYIYSTYIHTYILYRRASEIPEELSKSDTLRCVFLEYSTVYHK
jgi:hypothetical protein